MSIPAEPPAVVDDKRPPSSWPSSGTIHLQELKVYRNITCYKMMVPVMLKTYCFASFSFEDKIPTQCSLGSQRNLLHIQGRDKSGSCGENGKWEKHVDQCFVPVGGTSKWLYID